MIEPIRSRPLRRTLLVAVAGILALALLADRIYEYSVVFPRQIERQYTAHLQEQAFALSTEVDAPMRRGLRGWATRLVVAFAATLSCAGVIFFASMASSSFAMRSVRERRMVVALSRSAGVIFGHASMSMSATAGSR